MHLLNALPQRLDPGATPTFAGLISATLTSPAATDLTLAGGSSGASLVLGQGAAAGNATITPTGSGNIVTTSSRNGALKHALTNANAGTAAYVAAELNNGSDAGVLYQFGTAWTTSGRFIQASTLLDSSATGGMTLAVSGGTPIRFWSGAELARFAPTTGNLLIGTTSETGLTGAGGLKIASTTAGSSGAGALVVAGGISAGQSAQASWFGGNISVGGTSGAVFVGGFGQAHLVGTSGSLIVFERTSATARQWRMGVGILGADEWSLRDLTSSVQALTIAGATGAATFAGAVTIGGTVIHTLSATPASASATGTVGTMSWDASYIYICTAANTWKRVAIATW